MKNNARHIAAAILIATAISPCAVYADAINPHIRDHGKVYSSDKPNTTFYGTGVGGRAAEASELRFEIERDLQDGLIEAAVIKAKRAVQFDPSDPETHLLLARAMTRKFYMKKGEPDVKLLKECLYEWNLLWHHDSDQSDQMEAKREAHRMIQIAKTIDKQRAEAMKEELVARLEARQQRIKDRKAGKVATNPTRKGQSDNDESSDDEAKNAPTRGSRAQASTTDSSGRQSTQTKVSQAGSRAASKDNQSNDADDSQDETDNDKQLVSTRKKRFGLF